MSNAQTPIRNEPARLSYSDGQVIVTPKDQDRFLISAERAIEACGNAIRQDERVSRYKDEIILPLAQWCQDHADDISACYLLVPESAVLPVYVIGATEQYNFTLADELAGVASSFQDRGWSIHISQIPNCEPGEVAGYFDTAKALQLHGD